MQLKAPTISVLMSVYNDLPNLGKAVESILRQSYSKFEFIIVNDGSTDGSLILLKKYAKEDDRIRLFDESNKGLTKELQFALEHVKGDFVARMDGDDIAFPNRFQHQIDFMTSNPEVVCSGTNVMFIDEDGDLLSKSNQKCEHQKIEEELFSGRGGAIYHPTMIAQTEAVKKIGGYDTRYKIGQDLDLFLRLGEVGKLANSSEITLNFRRSCQSTTTLESKISGLSRRRKIIKEACLRRNKAYDPNTVTVTAADSMMRFHLGMSEKAANSGFTKSSFKHLLKAVRNPQLNFGRFKQITKILLKNISVNKNK